MKINKKVLAIIPARSGSKGVKNKNIFRVNGKPLIYYTIKRALESKLITDFIVSTDSLKIQKISEKFGAKIPFLRPSYLATDRSNIIDTMIYCIRKLEKEIKYDYIVLLQPTSPFRKRNEIDLSIKKIINKNFDSIISLTKIEEPHPIKLKRIYKGRVFNFIKNKLRDNPPRQSLEKAYKPSGNIYISKRDIVMKEKKILGKNTSFILVKEKNFLNIDKKEDLLSAKKLLKNFR